MNSQPAPKPLAFAPQVKVTTAYESFWRFAAERQEIFFRRVRGKPHPWTNDPVLAKYKFTNAYRASDRVSQYLIRNVIYRDDLPGSPNEVLFRILLFKFFNKIDTWKALERELGPLVFENYRFAGYDAVLTTARQAGRSIYSAAYIMPPGNRFFGRRAKHRNHLLLLERMVADQLGERLTETRSMRHGFEMLHSYPTIGNFLAYQLITDINYSELTDFDEMDFVMPGPGASDGLRKCFADPDSLSESDLIRLVAARQEQEFERYGIHFQELWGRRLHLIDCQNLFCEIGKYARVAHPHIAGTTGRVRIKQRFVPSSKPIKLFFPPKWKLNDKINGATLQPASVSFSWGETHGLQQLPTERPAHRPSSRRQG
ncbi:MAG: putative DNA base hypermodification protein [Rhodobacteraceae bacterium]|nr:putative DNA base hypermodification protein [Paracoccaceae bacterium]